MVKVSIIFVSYNTEELTLKAIESVVEKTKNITYEIIVVDNNSSDNTVVKITELYPKVILIKNDDNLGFGHANNIGARKATGDYLFLLNTDTVLINNAVYILYEYLNSNKNICAVGPNLFDSQLNPATSYSKLLPSILMDLDEFFFNISSKFKYLNMNFNYGNKCIIHQGAISGAAVLIRKDMFNKMNGFDERFFLYYEETDLFYRMGRAGCKLASNPNAKIIHYEGGSETLKEKTLHQSFKSKFIYLSKHHTLSKVKFHHYVFAASSMLRILVFKLMKNERKCNYWLLLRTVEREEYRHFKKI